MGLQELLLGEVIPLVGNIKLLQGRFLRSKTRINFLYPITRLYEQGADNKRIGQYVKELESMGKRCGGG